ncbi:hypothetical protein Kpol_472p17 [Vanderwaltozyma polyspora DSM 70294]|uniref:Transaldolase n=1 Tax=Vanderwaltozyma polyspora (strain ATCC 22028 / DSM 70294 / BCRC 21397 / CBS 2163 / NBRC 10782 / NRRL Y-8283 / UCD 57-17) TaxID=436907 RepID=A7TQI5_VANPO|nr:uncharacterized protein Kpol_472p17 [Vanderwaltozyma polyspora DSM 70294]EDO15486.1 hypothetical protein Kpol_472p17 [Vanderwaltozyma polyspora DSM 70294]
MAGHVDKKQKNGTSLDSLKQTGTVIVADTGDFESIEQYKPQDSTTNPTLILQATKKEQYSGLIDVAVNYAKMNSDNFDEQVDLAFDRLLVEFGREILQIVPGRVSTEVDARLSFDKDASVNKALKIIKLYEEIGVPKERVLIKLASTWEGILAAKELESKHGIHVNCTLLFSFPQAVAAAEAGVTLISPFVGRIMDWYKNKTGKTYSGEDDPGVKSVKKIFNYYKKHGYKTIVMGASFRNIEELRALAGIDYLTISPKLLDELYKSKDPIPKVLDVETAKTLGEEKVSFIDDESSFRFALNEDAMATEKLSEGIRLFSKDAVTLFEDLKKRIEETD